MKEAFKRLNGKKNIDLNLEVIAKKINILNTLDLIEINIEENNNLYENLTLKKADIFPLPKENDILNIKNICVDYDENLVLRVMVKADIKEHKEKKNEISINNKNIFSFSEENIIKSLIKIIEIKEEVFSSVFIVKEKKDKFYILFSLKDLKIYKISIETINIFSMNEFMLILNYNISKDNEIILNNITIVDKLNEEKLFAFYFMPQIFGRNLSLFKVVDINDKFFIVVNQNQKIFKIIKDEYLKNLDIKICQLLLVLNSYKLIDDLKTDLKIILLENDSIIHMSQQEIYFSQSILINFFTVINIHFLDYNESNYYDKIIIENTEFNIDEKEKYCVVCAYKENDYYSTKIILEKSKKDKSNIIFHFFIYKGLLNKINAFINNHEENSYFIEYFFMSIDYPLKEIDIDTKIIIEMHNKKYELKYFDNFDSINRKRYNVLNVPFQKIKNFDENGLLTKVINSIQISKIFYKKNYITFGIFNIREVIPKKDSKDNSYFDNYYKDFGDVYDYIIENKNVIEDIKNICKFKYNNSEIDKSKNTRITIYNSKLTLSQFKTRIGLLLCYYISQCENEYQLRDFLADFYSIQVKIGYSKLSYLQKLRIMIFFLRKKCENSSSLDKLISIQNLPENSPFFLADKLNKEEIKNLTEFSRFFAAYLHIDSYIMYNYLKKEPSYTFSLELLFVMKFLLLSNYEDFIFTTNEISDSLAYNADNENITVINQNKMFKRNIVFQRNFDSKTSMDLAFPISLEFRHEKNCHKKKNHKNSKYLSPFLFYRDGKFEKIKTEVEIEGKIIKKGESGRLVESFLTTDETELLNLKNVHIFGELLDNKLFIGRDFDNLRNKMKEIMQNKKKQKISEPETEYKPLDKIEKKIEISNEVISKNYTKELEAEGIVRFGDIHYTKEKFEEMLKNYEEQYK